MRQSTAPLSHSPSLTSSVGSPVMHDKKNADDNSYNHSSSHSNSHSHNNKTTPDDLLKVLIQRQCELSDTYFKLQRAQEEVTREIAANNSAIASLQRLSHQKEATEMRNYSPTHNTSSELKFGDTKTSPSAKPTIPTTFLPPPPPSSSSSSSNRTASPPHKRTSTAPSTTTANTALKIAKMSPTLANPYIHSPPTSAISPTSTIVSPSQKPNSSPSLTHHTHPPTQTQPQPRTQTQTISSCTAASIDSDSADAIPSNTIISPPVSVLTPNPLPTPTPVPVAVPHMLPTLSYLASQAGMKSKHTHIHTNTPSPPAFTHRKHPSPKHSPTSPSYLYNNHPSSPITVSGQPSSPCTHDIPPFTNGNNGGSSRDWLVVFDSKIGQ